MNLFEPTLLDGIREAMLRREETVSVAESVSSGLLQFAFSCMKDGVNFFSGGITCYNLKEKVRHLSINEQHAKEVNCVSGRVASEMAAHVAEKFSTDWGIGITGYATPVEESGQQVYAYYSISYKGKEVCDFKIDRDVDDPQLLQVSFCKEVLQQFHKALGKQE